MSPIRVGVVGCGRIARAVHLPVLSGLAGATVVALADPDKSSRQSAQRLAPTATVFESHQPLIEARIADALVVCSPPDSHVPCAVAAFDAGLHVYLEKPLAPSLEEAHAAVAAWRRSGKVGMIGFNFRFHPQLLEIRERIRSGAIGRPIAVRSVFSITPHERPAWKGSLKQGGGVLLDLGSHHADI